MSHEKGNLSINSENILPIIKKWLYSDTDIFVREVASNAADAITKLKKLADMGEAPGVDPNEKYYIKITLDKENKIITVEDNGIGMTADEIKQYINQIAFSGASDFLSKYKDKIDKDNEIIGHFGLGFYSVFMVSDKVQIDSLSYMEGAQAARWICEGGVEFEMEGSNRDRRGTVITLYIGDDGKDFLEEYKLRSTILKYCNFMPVEIFFDVVKPVSESKADDEIDIDDETDIDDVIDIDDEENIDDDTDINDEDNIKDEKSEIVVDEPKPINDTNPLWLKHAGDCTDEEYKAFYHKVFTDFNEPLFWIHLNMDYPFRLKGILYFPKLKHELESIEGQVKLYNNQVYIADNIKEVIPEFLLLLKGALDCPDLPLNVSRSFLQNDGYVTKMSGYITRKVADKLNSMFKKDRETFNKYWEDISPFIKYGCIKEKNFYDKIKDSILYKTINSEFLTIPEFMEKNKEKTGETVFYVSNEQQQAQYIKMFKDQEMDAVVLTTNLDNPFMSYIESYDRNIHFNRIDSDISDSLKVKDEENADKDFETELKKLFQSALNNDKLNLRVESLKSDNISAVMLLSEQSRRMQEMSKMFGGFPNTMPSEETLVLNKNNSLVKSLFTLKENKDRQEDVYMICHQVYDLAMMSHKPLEVEEMTKFIERSNELLLRIADVK